MFLTVPHGRSNQRGTKPRDARLLWNKDIGPGLWHSDIFTTLAVILTNDIRCCLCANSHKHHLPICNPAAQLHRNILLVYKLKSHALRLGEPWTFLQYRPTTLWLSRQAVCKSRSMSLEKWPHQSIDATVSHYSQCISYQNLDSIAGGSYQPFLCRLQGCLD
jgi:hypothetical protein